ncbi:MAG: lipid-A-disaccharide synthase-related protein [Prochlorotrichaceae cyanobacterium]
MTQRVLFISNGHGEDNHSAHIIQSLRELAPQVEIAALAIVGDGSAYRRLGVPLIAPTQTLPSGGFTYMNRWLLLEDLRSGLLGLTWQQWQAMRRYAPSCDLVHATGDSVGQSFAYGSQRPFISFISCLSALYEGHLQLDLLLQWYFRSSRCLQVFTRDVATAENLQQQGLAKVKFGGIPSLDRLKPQGKDLHCPAGSLLIGLLPGSRLPEALRNFQLQLRLVQAVAELGAESSAELSAESTIAPLQFRAALVPGVMTALPELAAAEGWECQAPGKLVWRSEHHPGQTVEILCYSDAFNDILHQSTLILGMAGLAVDQAVALGKPVLQIPGEGPQFTYRFAEAQNRLLGLSAQTIGTRPADRFILQEAAQCLLKTVNDRAYLEQATLNGQQRLGQLGASYRIAETIVEQLGGGRIRNYSPNPEIRPL